MIRALVWKETREQGVIVGALAVLGVAVLLAVGILNREGRDSFDPSRIVLTDPGALAVVMLTVTAGAVVGGTLFAAEKENGTDVFLSLLPVRRRGVWAGKMLAGGVLVLVVAAMLTAVAAPLGLLGRGEVLWYCIIGLPTLALAAFAWGSVGSILTRSSLAAAGLGSLFLALAAVLLLPLAAVVLYFAYSRLARWIPWVGLEWGVAIGSSVLFTLLVLPALVSLRLYTRPDRDRLRRAVRGQSGGTAKPPRTSQPGLLARLTSGFRAAVWMNIRQQRRFTLVLCAVGLVSGFGMIVPSAPFAAVWPPASLLLAVLVGTLGWYDEQASGAKRFWLERRLPVARLWWAKVLVGLFACLLVMVVTLAPAAVKAWLARRDDFAQPSFLLTEFRFPLVTFLLLWPAYGFAFGHLVGMLFRKTAVAVAVAVMLAAVAAAVWLPSVLGGGLHWWQVWSPLAVVFAAARVTAWACVADRIGTVRALGRLAVGGGVLLAVVGAGLGYRVVEIPDDVAGRKADVRFEQEQIPRFEDNLAGQEYRRGGVQLHEAVFGRGALQEQLVRRLVSSPLNAAYSTDPILQFPKQLETLLSSTLEHGWQPGIENDRILAAMFATGWDQTLESASQLPLGTLEDPRDLTLNTLLRHLHAMNGADALLLVRGLKAQHDGDPERFVTDFAQVLHLSHTVRNKSVQGCAVAGRRMEQRAMQAVPRWMERLHGRDDLLAKLDALIVAHDAACGDDRAEIRLADQVVLRNTFKAPGEVLRRQWRHADADEDAKARMDIEADLIGVGWQMPWEEERHERLLARGNATGYGRWTEDSTFHGLPAIGLTPHQQSGWIGFGFSEVETQLQTERRAARLLIAIRRFELKHGRPPEAIAALVPEFLSAVPIDPFAFIPFSYRLARPGETVHMITRTPPPAPATLTELGTGLVALGGGGATVENPQVAVLPFTNGAQAEWTFAVPAGRPVVWSVGRDKRNDGGTKASTAVSWMGDLIYISPPVPAAR